MSAAIQTLPLSLDAGTAAAIGRLAAADDGIQSVAAPASRQSAAQAPNAPPARKDVSKVHDGPAPALTGPQRELLRALAWWRAMGHQSPARTQIAAIAGWRPKGSNLRNRLSELSAAGLVIYPSTGLVSLTNAGFKAAPAPDLGQTLIESVRAILTGPQLALFDELMRVRRAMRRADLAIAVGWEASGSNLRNRLSELAALELVKYPAAGVVALRDWVTAA